MSSKRNAKPDHSEVIDRQQTLRFRFNGQTIEALEGDTIGSALAASGIDTISRSFKYHRRRGLFCCSGRCPNCLVQVGHEPNVRACTRRVTEGLEVTAQNVWPSLEFDLLSLVGLGSLFMPVGFYYKTFIRPQALWPLYEAVIRRLAGLGKVYKDTPEAPYHKEYLHTELLVVGAGPAGISAASAADKAGCAVLLLERESEIGGHLRYSGDPALLNSLTHQLADSSVKILTGTPAISYFEDHWVGAATDEKLFKIRAKAVVFATGAYQQPSIFENNDLPGIFLGEGALRLLRLYGVLPGSTAVIATASEDGWETAQALREAGLQVIVVDERSGPEGQFSTLLVEAGVTVHWNSFITAAEGRKRVESVQLSDGSAIVCDTVIMASGWTPDSGLVYQARGSLQYQDERREHLPAGLPDGIYTAGRLTGVHHSDLCQEQGKQVGARAAAALGYGKAKKGKKLAAEPPRTGERLARACPRKSFVCLCEDVTTQDLEQAVYEGYNSIELLKRYSTISMGPCQGAMCSRNSISLCARANGQSVESTGRTTSRPPAVPVKLGVLAGQKMEPVRYTPMHSYHAEHGKMMTTGTWMRPEHYGSVQNEVRAVRNSVGMIDVSTLGKLRLQGPGVPDFLNKIYTNKWSKLAIGRVRYGILCNDEGVVLNDGVTARLDQEDWLMTTTSTASGSIFEFLQWWLQSGWGEGVHLVNQTDGWAAINVAGPRSREILAQLTDTDLSNEAFPYMACRQLQIRDIPCVAMRIGFTGELSYEIHCPASYGRALWDLLLEQGITPFGVEAQRVLRLEKGHIIVGQDTDATSDPIGAAQAWAVKLDKDDFLGKRALSKITAEGSPHSLVGFVLEDRREPLPEGVQCVDELSGQVIGWVSSCKYSPTLEQVIGLCWLPSPIAEDGESFQIRCRGQLYQGRVHEGAFYDPAEVKLKC